MNANLSYMLSRVQAVSTQTFKLNPQNSTTGTANQQIRISLPSNTLLNLRSMKLLFRATTAGGAARRGRAVPPGGRRLSRGHPAHRTRPAQAAGRVDVLDAGGDAPHRAPAPRLHEADPAVERSVVLSAAPLLHVCTRLQATPFNR